LLAEAAVRFGLAHDDPTVSDIDLERNLIAGPFVNLFAYDQRLGWVPRPHTRTVRWGVPVTTADHGLRLNGGSSCQRESQVAPILAVGDSFTFGDEVSDKETWPAHLETLLAQGPFGSRRCVLNAGVSSYGLDQAVLRAEALIPEYRPRLVIVSFIQDPVRVLQRVRHGVPKPYFAVTPAGLAIRNVPTPAPRTPDRVRRWLLTHSWLVTLVAQRGPQPIGNLFGAGTMIEHALTDQRSAEMIGIRLIEYLQALQLVHDFQLIMLAQPMSTDESTTDETSRVLASVTRPSTTSTVNAIEAMRAHAAADPAHAQSLFHSRWPYFHMSPSGNRYIAEMLLPSVLALLDERR
jgi:lysophospholipase L1-like esterase